MRLERYIREDFFLGGVFRNLDGLNGQLRDWLETVASPRVHATTRRVVNEAFAEEKIALKSLRLAPYQAVLRLERRASHEGMVSGAGNLYSAPDTTRRRVLEVHVLADAIRIFEDAVPAGVKGRIRRHQVRQTPEPRLMRVDRRDQQVGVVGTPVVDLVVDDNLVLGLGTAARPCPWFRPDKGGGRAAGSRKGGRG